MTHAYFVVPGLLIPPDAKSELSPEAQDALTSLSKGYQGEVLHQTFSETLFASALHYLWAWRVLTRSRKLPALAAYEWMAEDGPQVTTEVWHLHVGERVNGAYRALRVPLTQSLTEAVESRLRPILSQAGFLMQRWDDHFYLTRKTPWGVATRPWATLIHQKGSDNDMLALEGAPENALTDAKTLLQTLNEALTTETLTLGDQVINAVWISGGGHGENFYPPTTVRSVLTDDPAILWWAQCAGILNHRTASMTGATTWARDVPPGDVVAIVPSLWQPYLEGDWRAWNEAIPAVVAQIQTLMQAAKPLTCDQALIVACGRSQTASLSLPIRSSARSILAKLRPSKTLPWNQWLIEGEAL